MVNKEFKNPSKPPRRRSHRGVEPVFSGAIMLIKAGPEGINFEVWRNAYLDSAGARWRCGLRA